MPRPPATARDGITSSNVYDCRPHRRCRCRRLGGLPGSVGSAVGGGGSAGPLPTGAPGHERLRCRSIDALCQVHRRRPRRPPARVDLPPGLDGRARTSRSHRRAPWSPGWRTPPSRPSRPGVTAGSRERSSSDRVRCRQLAQRASSRSSSWSMPGTSPSPPPRPCHRVTRCSEYVLGLAACAHRAAHAGRGPLRSRGRGRSGRRCHGAVGGLHREGRLTVVQCANRTHQRRREQ